MEEERRLLRGGQRPRGGQLLRVAGILSVAAATLAYVDHVSSSLRSQSNALLSGEQEAGWSPEEWTEYYADRGGFPIDSLRTGYPTYASFASDRLPAHYELSEDGTANMVPIYDDNRTVGMMNATQNDAYAAYLKDWSDKWEAWPAEDTDLVAKGEDERSEGDRDWAVLEVGPTRYQFSQADQAIDNGEGAMADFGRGRTISFGDLKRDLQDEQFYGVGTALQDRTPRGDERFSPEFGRVGDDALLGLRRDVDGSDPSAEGAESGRYGVFPDY